MHITCCKLAFPNSSTDSNASSEMQQALYEALFFSRRDPLYSSAVVERRAHKRKAPGSNPESFDKILFLMIFLGF